MERRVRPRSTGRPDRVGRRGLQPRFLPYLFVVPTIVVIAGLNLLPLGFSIRDSLHHDSLLSQDHSYLGLKNYVGVLQDPAFQNAFQNTLEYLVLTVVLVLGFSVPIALWLQGVRRRRGLVIALVLLPWAVPGTVNGELWALIFKPTNGLLNGLLLKLHLIHTNVIWLQGAKALPVVTLTLVWQTVPIAALIVLAGLEYIPQELSEQARVDGAGSIRILRSITLPLLRPAIAITTVVSSIAAVGIFDQIYVLNGNAPTTISVVQQTYLYAFKVLDLGYAVSAAMIATVASVVISLVVLRVVYREVEF